jgi:hypothetical protein
MNVKTKQQIRKVAIRELQMMRAYTIFDSATLENRIIIVLVDHTAVVLRRASNAPDLCILRMGPTEEVNVVGLINDFDIVNIQYETERDEE